MPEPRWLDQQQQQHWRSFLEGSWSVFNALGRDLEEAAGLSLNEYEVLVRLSEAPNRTMRMSALADGTVSSRSRLTHTVGRMEKAGLVQRQPSTSDGRGVDCALTDVGFDRLRDAAPAHVESVRVRLVDQLNAEELATLGSLLERVSTRIIARSESERA